MSLSRSTPAACTSEKRACRSRKRNDSCNPACCRTLRAATFYLAFPATRSRLLKSRKAPAPITFSSAQFLPRLPKPRSARRKACTAWPRSAAPWPFPLSLSAVSLWRMPPPAWIRAPPASPPSASFRRQSIQGSQSSDYTRSLRVTAANDLRVVEWATVHSDSVLVNPQLIMRFCFVRFGLSIVKPLIIVVERGVFLELDEERVSV